MSSLTSPDDGASPEDACSPGSIGIGCVGCLGGIAGSGDETSPAEDVVPQAPAEAASLARVSPGDIATGDVWPGDKREITGALVPSPIIQDDIIPGDPDAVKSTAEDEV